MKTMTTIPVGRAHLRVTRADFAAWLLSRRTVVDDEGAECPPESVRATNVATRGQRFDKAPTQSVRRKAQELAEGRRPQPKNRL